MRALRYFANHYRAQSVVVLLCLLLAGVLEGVGFSGLLPILGLVAQDGSDAAAADDAPSRLSAAVESAMQRVGLEPSLEVLVPILAIVFWLKDQVERKIDYVAQRISGFDTDLMWRICNIVFRVLRTNRIFQVISRYGDE